MSTPFMGEIKLVSFNFAPKGWAEANGQLLPINQNQALFSLLGTTYGGNGQTTFALPNLRGQVPIHFGSGHTLGEKGGTTAVTVNIQQLPTHLHLLQGSTAVANTDTPANNTLLGGSAPNDLYSGPTNLTPMAPASVTNIGGSQAHNNMMPYLVLNFVIALQGIFPSQT
jgi:microcystin-dependent protein